LQDLSLRIAQRFIEARGAPYAAIFLDEGSKRRLIQWWSSVVHTHLFPDVHADHVTLKFNPSKSEAERYQIGQSALVQVLGFAEDDKAQAVLVRPSVASSNRFPHVTVAIRHGVNAVHSNELLAKGYTRKAGPILRGVVDIRH